MQFRPAANASGTTGFQFTVTDSGGTANGGLDSLSQFVLLTVTPVNDAPTLSATALNPVFTEAPGLGTQAAAVNVFSGASASTIESGQTIGGLTFTVAGLVDGASEVIVVDGRTVTLGANSSGTTVTNGLAYTSTVGGGTATIVLSGGTLSTAATQTLVNGITYQNTSTDNPSAGDRVVTLTQVKTAAAPPTAAPTRRRYRSSRRSRSRAVNDAPVATATGTALAYTENAAAMAVDPGVTVADLDSASLVSATVQVSSNYVVGEDVLSFTNTANISGSWNALNGSLTLTGSDTVAGYEAALRTVKLREHEREPERAAANGRLHRLRRRPDQQHREPHDHRHPGQRRAELGNGTLVAVAEDTVGPAGQLLSTVFAGQFADVDAGSSFAGMAVVGNTANAGTQGVWEYSSNGGTNWFAVGSVADGAARWRSAARAGSGLCRPRTTTGRRRSWSCVAWTTRMGAASRPPRAARCVSS